MEYLRLGDLHLSITDPLTGFEDAQGFTYAQHDMASGKPILQAIGATLGQLSLSVALREALGHDIAELKRQIDTIIASGQPQKFVFANGVYVGEYVVTDRGFGVNRTRADGTITEADLTLSLLEYADRVVLTTRNTESRPRTEPSNRKTKTQ